MFIPAPVWLLTPRLHSTSSSIYNCSFKLSCIGTTTLKIEELLICHKKVLLKSLNISLILGSASASVTVTDERLYQCLVSRVITNEHNESCNLILIFLQKAWWCACCEQGPDHRDPWTGPCNPEKVSGSRGPYFAFLLNSRDVRSRIQETGQVGNRIVFSWCRYFLGSVAKFW